MQNGPHEYAVDHTSFYVISKLFTQTFLIGRGEVTSLHIAYVKSTKKCRKTNLRVRAIQEPVFPVANTDFEGGDDDHGYGDCIFFCHLCATKPYGFILVSESLPGIISASSKAVKWVKGSKPILSH
jgi:hypothetical protein